MSNSIDKEIFRHPDAELIAAGQEFASLLARLNEIRLVDGPRTEELHRAADALEKAYDPKPVPNEAWEALYRRLDEQFPETAPGDNTIIEQLINPLELKIMSLPATTFEGVKAKAQVLQWRFSDSEDEDMDFGEKILRRFILEMVDPIAASKETFTGSGSRPLT